MIGLDPRDVVAGAGIDGAVADDRNHPRHRLRCERIEAVGRVPNLDKTVMQHFFGQLRPLDDALGHAKEQRGTHLVQAFEGYGGAFIPGSRSQQKSFDCLVVEHLQSYAGNAHPDVDTTYNRKDRTECPAYQKGQQCTSVRAAFFQGEASCVQRPRIQFRG
ncbi:hypothetical protein SBBP2_2540006 [Burkholderiales bacterium]|nr:hypothetical protein SBBP2_2540006 [Burkholderiales bacterium]